MVYGSVALPSFPRFDYRVIYEELGRCGLASLQKDWRDIAGKGYCSMNPVVGKWLLQCSRDEIGPHTTLALDKMTGYLFSEAEKKKLNDLEATPGGATVNGNKIE